MVVVINIIHVHHLLSSLIVSVIHLVVNAQQMEIIVFPLIYVLIFNKQVVIKVQMVDVFILQMPKLLLLDVYFIKIVQLLFLQHI